MNTTTSQTSKTVKVTLVKSVIGTKKISSGHGVRVGSSANTTHSYAGRYASRPRDDCKS
jgi:hypothetical protein